jgi:hypothetical protein
MLVKDLSFSFLTRTSAGEHKRSFLTEDAIVDIRNLCYCYLLLVI